MKHSHTSTHNPDAMPHIQMVWKVLEAAVKAKQDALSTCIENDETIMACGILLGLDRVGEFDQQSMAIVFQYYCEMFDLE